MCFHGARGKKIDNLLITQGDAAANICCLFFPWTENVLLF